MIWMGEYGYWITDNVDETHKIKLLNYEIMKIRDPNRLDEKFMGYEFSKITWREFFERNWT